MSSFQKVLIVGSNQLAARLHKIFEGSTKIKTADHLADCETEFFDFIWETEHGNLGNKKKTIQALEKFVSNKHSIVITSVLSVTCTEVSNWTNGHLKIVGFACFSDLDSQNLVELTLPLTGETNNLEAVTKQLEYVELETEFVEDQVGLVFPRVLSMIINEAFYAFTQKIAIKEDIDIAMKFGTNYPKGPLEWGECIGLDEVYSVLQGLYNNLQEERYRPAPLLRKFVISGWNVEAFARYENYKQQIKSYNLSQIVNKELPFTT
jgi:3-hydroxybutyryl-CoA dehydrogenase